MNNKTMHSLSFPISNVIAIKSSMPNDEERVYYRVFYCIMGDSMRHCQRPSAN